MWWWGQNFWWWSLWRQSRHQYWKWQLVSCLCLSLSYLFWLHLALAVTFSFCSIWHCSIHLTHNKVVAESLVIITKVILVMRVALIILRATKTQVILKMEAVKVADHVSIILARLKEVAGKFVMIVCIHLDIHILLLLYISYAHSHWIVNDDLLFLLLPLSNLVFLFTAKAMERVTKQLAQKARIAGKFQLMLNIAMGNRPHHLD